MEYCGVSANIIDATWLAITDSIEYGLWLKNKPDSNAQHITAIYSAETKEK